MPEIYKHTCNNVNKFTCLTDNLFTHTLQSMSIGKRLKVARSHAGISQLDLVSKLNGLMSQQNISQLESGTNKGTEYIVQLAIACGVSAEWLATGNGDMIKVAEYDLPPELLAHLKVLQELPDYARSEVIRDAIKTAELITKATTAANKSNTQ